MAQAPFFLTGAAAKIKVNNMTMAFADSLTYTVKIGVLTPKILGMYEAHSMEPVSYEVSGSFSIVRYISGVKDEIGGPKGTSNLGNGLGRWSASASGDGGIGAATAGALSRMGAGDDGRANEHLNPKLLATSAMFDIEVYQKVGAQVAVPEQGVFNRLFGNTVNNLAGVIGAESAAAVAKTQGLCGVARIRDCRIESSSFQIGKKGAVIQRFTFKAAYVDEDSFNAGFSGIGHHLGGTN